MVYCATFVFTGRMARQKVVVFCDRGPVDSVPWLRVKQMALPDVEPSVEVQ